MSTHTCGYSGSREFGSVPAHKPRVVRHPGLAVGGSRLADCTATRRGSRAGVPPKAAPPRRGVGGIVARCSGTLGRLPLTESTLAPRRRKPTLGRRKSILGRRKRAQGRRKLTLGRRKRALGRRKPTLGRRKLTLGWRKRAQGRSKLPPRRGQRPRPSLAHAPPGRKTLCHMGCDLLAPARRCRDGVLSVMELTFRSDARSERVSRPTLYAPPWPSRPPARWSQRESVVFMRVEANAWEPHCTPRHPTAGARPRTERDLPGRSASAQQQHWCHSTGQSRAVSPSTITSAVVAPMATSATRDVA